MDRKYRQSGYQDSGAARERPAEKREKPPGAPRTPMSHERPRSPRMPARRGVVRCAGCGFVLAPDVNPETACPKCRVELHSCKQCVNFDAGARWECFKPITAHVSHKDVKNDCTFYELKVTMEKETSSLRTGVSRTSSAPAVKPSSARDAFEALFKK